MNRDRHLDIDLDIAPSTVIEGRTFRQPAPVRARRPGLLARLIRRICL